MGTTFEQDFPLLTCSLRFADTAAFLRLEGEIDTSARPVLADIAAALHNRLPAAVFVDLGGVSFAGSTLVHFLDRVAEELPTGSTLALCRAGPVTLRLIQLTDIDAVVRLDDRLPAAWPPDQLDWVDRPG